MLVAGADGGKPAVWGVDLPVVVGSPAGDLPRIAQAAGVLVAGADGSKATGWSRLIAPVVASPALDCAVLAQPAGMHWLVGWPAKEESDGAAHANGGVGTGGAVISRVSPALDLSALVQAAGVLVTSADGSEAAGRGVDLPIAVGSPALDLPGNAQRASVVGAAGADGAKPSGGRSADRDLRAAQPAAYAGVNWEVASARLDALSVRRREGEFNPAVVRQPHIDSADFLAADLDRAGVEPALVINVRGEVAQARQDALSAGRLPSELGTAVGQPAGNDAAGLLVVALGADARADIGGDDRDG